MPTNIKFFRKFLVKKRDSAFDPDIVLRKIKDVVKMPDDVTVTDS